MVGGALLLGAPRFPRRIRRQKSEWPTSSCRHHRMRARPRGMPCCTLRQTLCFSDWPRLILTTIPEGEFSFSRAFLALLRLGGGRRQVSSARYCWRSGGVGSAKTRPSMSRPLKTQTHRVAQLTNKSPTLGRQHVAMREDRIHADERRDRGRSGRPESFPHRSVSPPRRRHRSPREKPRRVRDDTPPSSRYRPTSGEEGWERSERGPPRIHTESRKAVDSGVYRSRPNDDDRYYRHSEGRHRRSKHSRDERRASRNSRSPSSAKRHRSRSPSTASSYRKKARRQQREDGRTEPDLIDSNRQRRRSSVSHRPSSPEHRSRRKERIDREAEDSQTERSHKQSRRHRRSPSPHRAVASPQSERKRQSQKHIVDHHTTKRSASRLSQDRLPDSSRTRSVSTRHPHPPSPTTQKAALPPRPPSPLHHKSPMKTGNPSLPTKPPSAVSPGAHSGEGDMSTTRGSYRPPPHHQHSLPPRAQYPGDPRDYSRSPQYAHSATSYHESPNHSPHGSAIRTGRNGQEQYSPPQ